MKKTILISSVLMAGIALYGQPLSPHVISTSGNSFSSANSRMDFTIGETLTSTLTAGSNVMTQGFHQPEIKFASLEDYTDDLTMNLYPNPTIQFVTLKTDYESELKVYISDMNGKTLLNSGVFVSSVMLDLGSFASGNYVLMVTDLTGKPLKSYSIIKKSTN